ncbi:MAG TPA: hypothetical protein DCS55_01640 [Acidimicrobiaceae bacterium]|nr:hypothetical protein [Acidimicrobiaceae bacterium]
MKRGEVVALLGTNGAGRSTLLKAICGLKAPKAGTVELMGEGIFPTLTVAENLRLASWLIRDDPQRVKEAKAEVLDLFPILSERSGQLAGDLSGGEQQMLALGGALMTSPELLMMTSSPSAWRPPSWPGCSRWSTRSTVGAPPSSWWSSRSTWCSTWPSGPCSWRRASSASPARPPSCSTVPTSCARCSSPAPTPTRPTPATPRRRPSRRGRPPSRRTPEPCCSAAASPSASAASPPWTASTSTCATARSSV